MYHTQPAHTLNTNLYDTAQADEPSVAVSQSSPVLEQYDYSTCLPTQITHSHIASVPNPEAQYPNQAPYIPPNQRWARPLPDHTHQAPVQAPAAVQYAPHRRSSSQLSHESYSQNLSRRPSVDQASGYTMTPGYANVAQHQANQHEQNYYQQPTSSSGYAPAPSTHVYGSHIHANTSQQNGPSHHVQTYEPTQYQNQYQHMDSQNVPFESSATQTYGMFAPEEHLHQQQLAQNAPCDAYEDQEQGLLLAASYNFGVPADHAPAVEPQNHEHVKHEQYDGSQGQYHQHQGHEYHQQHNEQYGVAQSNGNGNVGYEYHQHVDQSASHSRRNSDFAVSHEQTQFQQQPESVAHYSYPQNTVQPPPASHVHSHSRSSSTSEPPTKKLAAAPSNPLLYPEESATKAQTQLVSTGENPNQPEDTLERQHARYYQHDLEIKFLERAGLKMGHPIGTSYPRNEYQDHQGATTSPLQQPQCFVPSQAPERPVPIPAPTMSAPGAQSPDKKEPQTTPKKPALACLFCRKRKIACGPPPPDSPDRTCNQCARRKQCCEYPTESRRGIRKPANKEPAKEEDDEDTPSPSAMRFVKHDPNELPKPKGKGRGKRSHSEMSA
ncbi:Fungal Zn(2)-Cys(6) binuclear cluster domain [Ceratobasidium sp. AG-Ba]|nr:Fungal Zn(2)-Cys(6) binuclear cluster domain [Ceratobasidium sp. AG-Ba]